MRFIDFLNENTNSKSRTDKWTLDQIKNAKYSSSFMDDREEVCIKGKSYVKIGKDKWQYFSTNPHVIGGTCTDNDIYKMMHESVKNDDKIVFHSYDALKEYCADPNNPLDRVVLGKEITSLYRLFLNSSRTNEQFDGISEWDVSNVTSMAGMFKGAKKFNQPLDNWDVSNVKNMAYMFHKAASFNQSLNNWDVSNVEDMQGMFCNTLCFNQPLNKWDVSNVEDMSWMFYDAFDFNQPLDKWDVSNVEDMNHMFSQAYTFNQPLNNWDVSKVWNMDSMFYDTDFNQPLKNWDVSNVETMEAMFYDTKKFNQSLDDWDVSKVKSMEAMLRHSKLEKEHNLPKWYK